MNSRIRSLRGLIKVILVFLILSATAIASEKSATDRSNAHFTNAVQPLLRRHCYRCHGPNKEEGGVRFSIRESAFGHGESDETIILPHQPDKSLILKRLTDKEYGDVMPLDAEPLAKNEIELVREWIADGAPWPDTAATDHHWAYIKPSRPATPAVEHEAWPNNEIDNFILARIEEVGLAPSEPADRARLIRRLYLALTGLPPTIEEVDAFIHDDSPTAYEQIVDRLLESERYGERWAQRWLDLARYADSNGFQADQLRDSWAYRDWVIRAINYNMPFDQFVIEQLAGDMLPNATLEQKIATGFHRTPTCNVEAGVHPEANRVNQVIDRVNTTATVFLGTTLECCQCHDHKYDPFTQKDYYRVFAYFNNTPLEVKLDSGVQYNFVGPSMELPLTPKLQARREELQAKLVDIQSQQDEARQLQLKGFEKWLAKVSVAIRQSPAEWQPLSVDKFTSTGQEDHTQLEDGSVLLGGSVPGTAVYELHFSGNQINKNGNAILGFKIEAMTHESLPGNGPGRGDPVRNNFILSEVTCNIESDDRAERQIGLNSAEADFSQQNWEVHKAIDGDQKTGWAIAPKFNESHWATFRTDEPLNLSDDQEVVLRLHQNYGRGRVIGRVRVSALVGDELTVGVPDNIAELLLKKIRKPKETKRLQDHFINSNPEIHKLELQAQATQKQLNQIQPPTTLVMTEMDEARETPIFKRGNYLDPGEKVESGTIAALHPMDASLPPNRLGLAQWLVSTENPLVARVAVNRWWSAIFGRGIVTTPEDFGTQSEPPTHPELLDWLAVEFMDSGWSMKHIHKLMVMSSTFRQSSKVNPHSEIRNPQSEALFARGPRFRLPAETIRDNALAVSGLLSTKMYGPPIMPYQPDGIWKAVGRNQPIWLTATDEDRFRRGVYIVWKRGAPYPSFVNFDAPDRAACTVQRPRTNTPLQALTMLNDPAYAEMAASLAQRMMTVSGDATIEGRASFGFRLCVARVPTEQEVDVLKKLYLEERAKMERQPTASADRSKNLLAALRNSKLDQIEFAAWFAVANVLLNLDETISL